MATVNNLMDRAGKMLGMLEPNTSLSVNESADFFVSLNAMINSWQNEKLMVYDIREDSFAMVSGQVTYTIGSGGNFNIPRPVYIESMFVRQGTVDYPLMEQITLEQFANIASKTSSSSSVPTHFKYDASFPLASVTVWPSPNATNALRLRSYRVVSAFAAQTDAISLPPGYEDALAYNLAVREAPAGLKNSINNIIMLARETKASIKRANARPIIATTPILSAMTSSNRANIYQG